MTIHCRSHVVVLGNALLNAKVFILLVLRFVTNVGDARFLVLENIKRFSLHRRALDFVSGKRRIDFFLLRCLRRERVEASCRQQ